MYGSSIEGFRYYPKSLLSQVIRGSLEAYFTTSFIDGYFSELHHGWLSSETKAESYNMTHLGSYNTERIKMFLKFNPEQCKHFNKRKIEAGDEEDECQENRIWEMKRKTLKLAMYNQEIKKELNDRQMIEKFNFGPRGKSFQESCKEFMKKVDESLKGELYEHKAENCSTECEKRGCSWVITLDGLWKLSYPICMWYNNNASPKNVQDILPNVCTEEPLYRKAFCKDHCKTVHSWKLESVFKLFFGFRKLGGLKGV